jgi:hypothetical protein
MNTATATLDAKLAQIASLPVSDSTFGLSKSLFHAYVACLSLPDLCEAIQLNLMEKDEVRRPFRRRLIKIAGEYVGAPELEGLARSLLARAADGTTARRHADAMLSHLYPSLLPTTRKDLLDHWKGRGSRSAASRWLKALANDPLLFSIGEIVEYWRASHDDNAAKVVVAQGDAKTVETVLSELIAECSEGWIVARATIKASAVSEGCWNAIRERFPASYAYLCAKLRRSMGEDEAIQIVRAACAANTNWLSNDGGLAIWAEGQMGMWSTLDRIAELLPELEKQQYELIGLTVTEGR